MARISGIDLPRNKRLDIALTTLYGVGRSRSAEILNRAEVPGGLKTSELTEDQVRRIRQIIDEKR